MKSIALNFLFLTVFLCFAQISYAQTDSINRVYNDYQSLSKSRFKTARTLGIISAGAIGGGVALASYGGRNGTTAAFNTISGITLIAGGIGTAIVALPYAVVGFHQRNKARSIQPYIQQVQVVTTNTWVNTYGIKMIF